MVQLCQNLWQEQDNLPIWQYPSWQSVKFEFNEVSLKKTTTATTKQDKKTDKCWHKFALLNMSIIVSYECINY